MGTRSMTYLVDDDGKCQLAIYRQYDGYPEGMGKDLCSFLKDRKIANGIGPDAVWNTSSNGMGDLAAQLVMYLKEQTTNGTFMGNLYLYPPEMKDMSYAALRANANDHWAEYFYEISEKDGKPWIRVSDMGKDWAFEGSPEDCAKHYGFTIDEPLSALEDETRLNTRVRRMIGYEMTDKTLEEAVKAYLAAVTEPGAPSWRFSEWLVKNPPSQETGNEERSRDITRLAATSDRTDAVVALYGLCVTGESFCEWAKNNAVFAPYKAEAAPVEKFAPKKSAAPKP